MRSVVSILPFSFLLASACNARLLDVGTEPDAGANTNVNVAAGCTAASCANQTLTCSGSGKTLPSNLQCVPHPDAGAVSIFSGTCMLTGTCDEDAGAVSCATTPPAPMTSCTGSGPCASAVEAAGGSGYVSVTIAPVSPGNASATSTVQAFFTAAIASNIHDQNFGDCVYAPTGAERGESGTRGPAPNPGEIDIMAPGFSADLFAACDGTYGVVQSAQAPAAGDAIAFSWSRPTGNPYGFPVAESGLPAPHFVALASADSLAASSPTLPRSSDIAVDWTSDGTPLALEQVLVELTQGDATLTCGFASSAGSGVIPADALLVMQEGAANYAVYAEHAHSQTSPPGDTPGLGWTVQFLIDAVATTPTGLAKGTLTLQ